MNQPNAISRLNALGTHDYLEAMPLIIECLEQGLYQWTNPTFLRFLHHQISCWAIDERTFLRACLYARHLVSVMPSGVDDGIRSYFERLSTGRAEGDDYGLRCAWPQPLPPVWDGRLFWIGQQIRKDRAISNWLKLKV